MSLVSETVQIPKRGGVAPILAMGNLIKMKNPCQCCKRRIMETYGVCHDCSFFCHGYCEFNQKDYIVPE